MASTEIENISDASALVSIGTNALLNRNYTNAVDAFRKASTILSDENGVTSVECARVYLSYAKAILYNGLYEDMDSDESMSENDDLFSSSEEDGINTNTGDADKSAEGSIDKQDADNNNGVEVVADGPKTAETVTSIELAWKVLEMARFYLEMHPDNSQDLLAEVYAALAEWFLESGSIQDARDQLKKCLGVQKGILDPHDRRIALTHFEIGLAYEILGSTSDAINNYEEACYIQYKIKADVKESANSAAKLHELDCTMHFIAQRIRLINESDRYAIAKLRQVLMVLHPPIGDAGFMQC